jgi:exopolyphosphatase/guanosine-5'-triphosphate,3'-diphosphate pyrophosphatase
MITTTIDIGTNTILMLIGEFDNSSFQIKTLLDTQRIPRLGKGVDANRNIPDESIQKAINILNEYKIISSEYGSNIITAAATSFLRDANNNQAFIGAIKKETGIEIEILSGADEARWTFWGGVYEQLQSSDSKLQICTIDIGGGSTEITNGIDIPSKLDKDTLFNHPIQGKSVDMGSVRINEKFLKGHPHSLEKITLAENFIKDNLRSIDFEIRNDSVLIGVAGTITTLAAIKLMLNEFDREIIDGLKLRLEDINDILNDMYRKTLSELFAIGNYMEGRADIIIPGTLILKNFMEKFNFDEIKVSSKGLRYGIFLREALN